MGNILRCISEVKPNLPQGKTFTLIGGCFDLIHVGHLHLVQFAASLESVLVVAVLSDSYCSKYKGAHRPVIPEDQRAKMVAGLQRVDLVYVTDVSPSGQETLQVLKPDSVVFEEEARGTEKMLLRESNIHCFSPDTKIHFLPRYTESEVSTSSIIERIKKGEAVCNLAE